jgi:manganese transport protein
MNPVSTTRTDAAAHLSLAEVHSSVHTARLGLWRRMFAFAGPAYLVSVGYMDPGNWATDLEGGARFGYRLLWVLVMSNLMAILLQTLSARLGIVGGRDLAQACRETYPRPVTHALWVLCEIAIAACDLAEVLGAAISLNLLFQLPLLWGVILTAADTLLVLWFQRFGIRIIEAFVLALITIIAGCFCVEIFLAKPAWSQMATGLIPRLDSGNLYIVVGIIGATVMPHNLYLHSALVQTRRIGLSEAAKRVACRYNLIDSVVALNGALLVNAAILIVAGTVFFSRGIVVTEIQQAHLLLAPLLGTTVAGAVFAIALLASGQSSTLTGTLAGQIVMEGFLNFRMRPWLRRLVTRSLAVIPAAITIYFTGNSGTFRLLILSQVIINMQLPFAVIPLLHFTGDRRRMGEFVNKLWVSILSWIVAAIILVLDAWLVWQSISDWLSASGAYRPYVLFFVVVVVSFVAALLVWITAEPLFARWGIRFGLAPITLPPTAATVTEAPVYRRILVPLDHTALDHVAIAHAAAMARMHHAKLYLLHVEEDVTSQIYGSLSSTAEVQAGRQYLNDIVASLRAEGVQVETMVAHSSKPTREIIRCASLIQPDLLVMGAHGHGGLKDLIFGATINSVRHKLRIPLLVVRSG